MSVYKTMPICDICCGEYPLKKHNFEECCSLDVDWDIANIEKATPSDTNKDKLIEVRAVQGHGFDFENEIRCKVFGLPADVNNTDKWDIPKGVNKFDPNENISIKMTGGSSIGCSDIIRFHGINFEEKNTMILGQYTQSGRWYKTIDTLSEITYTEEFHRVLFGGCPKSELANYVAYIKTVSRADSKEYLAKKKALQKKYNMNIVINPKVDSKKQRRVQCSIPLKLFKKYPQFIKNVELLRGVAVNRKYRSSRRKFK
jgi:hypothetical protein